MANIQNGVQATFQIGELAKRSALSIDAIRFYERRKLLLPAPRSAGRFRLYTPDAIERLRFAADAGFGFFVARDQGVDGSPWGQSTRMLRRTPVPENETSRCCCKNPRAPAT